MSAAAAMVVGVGTGSALFVDYLADRAMARADEPVATKPVITASVPESGLASAAPRVVEATAQAQPEAAPAQSQPVHSQPAEPEPVPLEPVPIEAALPDPEVLAKVVVAGSEHAVEVPGDDPTASPVLQFNDDQAEADEPFEALTSDGPAQASSSTRRSQPADEEVEVAALPGVETETAVTGSRNLGGLPPGAARVTSAVNLRAGPKKGAGVLGVVPGGSQVNVISCNGWCQITHDGRTGWVYKSFLSASAARAAPAPQNAKVENEQPSPPARAMKSPRLQD